MRAVVILFMVLSVIPLFFGIIGLAKINDDNTNYDGNITSMSFCPNFGQNMKIISILNVLPFVNVFSSPFINVGFLLSYLTRSYDPLDDMGITGEECYNKIMSTCVNNIYLNCSEFVKYTDCYKFGNVACKSYNKLRYPDTYNYFKNVYIYVISAEPICVIASFLIVLICRKPKYNKNMKSKKSDVVVKNINKQFERLEDGSFDDMVPLLSERSDLSINPNNLRY